MTPPDPVARRSIHALDALALVETLAYVRQGVPCEGARILEVGCGDGDLAAALGADGHRVVALDAAEAAVARARAAGVAAVHARWPDFDHPPVDAILFTRSLHHLEPLGPALDRAADLLLPGGVLLVEDFAFEEVDAETVAWFRAALGRVQESGLLTRAEDTFVGRFIAGGGDLTAWRSEHPHELHSARTMQRAIEARFEDLEVRPAPYLYRYVASALAPCRRGFAALRLFLEMEARRIVLGDLAAVGRRFTARRRR